LDGPPSGWRVVTQQSFEEQDGPATEDLHDGCTNSIGAYSEKRLLLRLDSCRDYTYQVAFETVTRRTDDSFYIAANVQYLSGPSDGYCALLIGWQDNEHYYAFKLGRDTFEVTRDKGGLPHQGIDGIRSDPAIRSGASNRIAILSDGDITRLAINQVVVSEPHGLDAKAGQLRLGVQATTRSDLVTCAFDDIELRTP